MGISISAQSSDRSLRATKVLEQPPKLWLKEFISTDALKLHISF